MTNFSALAAARESCRSFSDRPVTDEQLRSLIRTAAIAPSACNSQPWQFIAVNGGELARAVAKSAQGMGMNKFTDQVPAFIAVAEEPANLLSRFGGKLKDQQFAQIDIGIAVAHLCLQAADIGLSTCILGWFNEKKLAELLGVPPSKRLRLLIAVGYAATDALRPKKRKPFDEIARFV